VLAAPWPETIREAQKILFPDLVEDCPYRVLDDLVFQRRDSQRELHMNAVSLWVGPKSSILSTRFAAKASRY
jgi:hypothetical protein